MCFKNLPIEFDEAGNARLKDGVPDPFSFDAANPANPVTDADREERIKAAMARQGHIKDLNIDPVTRVAGALAIHVVADLDEGRHLDAHAQGVLFRGYEVIAMGRDPRDAIFITSRVCGVCGGVHSHAAAYALEMAMGIPVPPMGTAMRNVGEAAEMVQDNATHLYLLAGPDYSEQVVKAANPELWPLAEKWESPRQDLHGFATMADIMRALNPVTGELYRDGLALGRKGKELWSLFHGKYPHPQTIVPGGLSSTIHMETLNECHSRFADFFDHCRTITGVYDDIADFFYEADPRYKQVGIRKPDMVDTGYWDDPEAYDSHYETCNEWGEKRWSTPGAIIDGELVTTRLTDLNLGMEEFVNHSFYERWSGDRYPTDPLGNPLSPHHPWNKTTVPKPEDKDWKDRYSWSTSPRWDRRVVEAGPYARLWITAMAQKQPPNDFIVATGDSVKMFVPKSMGPEVELEYKLPRDDNGDLLINAFERNRARAHHLTFSALVGFASLLQAYELQAKGEFRVASYTPEELEDAIPTDERIGVGFWGAGRGWLTHHVVMDNGKIVNYQVVTPSSWNCSPRDPWEQPGPYEEAVMNTPIIEDTSDPSQVTGIDMLRAVRSFDPCMPCTVHLETGKGTILREVNTCECGIG